MPLFITLHMSAFCSLVIKTQTKGQIDSSMLLNYAARIYLVFLDGKVNLYLPEFQSRHTHIFSYRILLCHTVIERVATIFNLIYGCAYSKDELTIEKQMSSMLEEMSILQNQIKNNIF